VASKNIIQSIELNDKKIQELNRKLLDTETSQNDVELILDSIGILLDTFDTIDILAKQRLLRIILKDITWDGEKLILNFI